MVRDAAGIVRATRGNTPGAILAHLREVGSANVSQAVTSPLLVSTGALAAIQVASTVYLSRKLDKLEGLTRQVLNETQRVLAVAEEIREEQYREKARNLWRALEFLRLWQRAQDERDLRRAFEHFVLGKADIFEVLRRTDVETVLENPERTRFLLNAAAMNGAGQLLVMNHLDYPAPVQLGEAADYSSVLDAKASDLLAMPGPRTRLPTSRMLQATEDMGGPVKVARSWGQSLDTVSRTIEAEVRFVDGLADVPRKDVRSFGNQLKRDNSATYCLLVEESA